MITSILIKLAEWLIKYLINYNWGLSKELREAKDRVYEHQIELDKVRDSEKIVQQRIDEGNVKFAQISIQLDEITNRIEQERIKHNEKITELESAIGSKSDNDVLNSDLRTNGNS